MSENMCATRTDTIVYQPDNFAQATVREVENGFVVTAVYEDKRGFGRVQKDHIAKGMTSVVAILESLFELTEGPAGNEPTEGSDGEK